MNCCELFEENEQAASFVFSVKSTLDMKLIFVICILMFCTPLTTAYYNDLATNALENIERKYVIQKKRTWARVSNKVRRKRNPLCNAPGKAERLCAALLRTSAYTERKIILNKKALKNNKFPCKKIKVAFLSDIYKKLSFNESVISCPVYDKKTKNWEKTPRVLNVSNSNRKNEYFIFTPDPDWQIPMQTFKYNFLTDV